MSHLLAMEGDINFNYIVKYFKGKISIKDLIIKSLQSKIYYIEKDEFDKKDRKLLNFGHAFGHAIESATNYKIPHGICVLRLFNCILDFKKLLTNQNYLKYEKIIKLIIDKKINFNILKFKKAVLRDKKANKNKIGFILSYKCGQMFIKEMEIDLVFLNYIKTFNRQIEFK